MRRWTACTLAVVALVFFSMTVTSQPPGGDDPPKKKKKKDGPDGGPPPRFQLGKVLPPPLRADLDLTREQEEAIHALEKEIRQRLLKILTPEQRQKADGFRPKGPPKGPKKGKGDDDGPPPKKGKDGPPPDEAASAAPAAGIQWFATWESGLREARRSGRPILLVSAAPHCAGVSGTW
jgi:hypothetical protein